MNYSPGEFPIRFYTLACIFVFALSATNAQATLIQATYQISASNFLDSGSNPPLAPTSTVVTGSYQFTFDTQLAAQTAIVPDPGGSTTPSGNIIDIVDSNGSVIGFDQTNSGVNTDVNIFTNVADITIGGTLNGVGSLVGLSDDFSTRFRISLIDFGSQLGHRKLRVRNNSRSILPGVHYGLPGKLFGRARTHLSGSARNRTLRTGLRSAKMIPSN